MGRLCLRLQPAPAPGRNPGPKAPTTARSGWPTLYPPALCLLSERLPRRPGSALPVARGCLWPRRGASDVSGPLRALARATSSPAAETSGPRGWLRSLFCPEDTLSPPGPRAARLTPTPASTPSHLRPCPEPTASGSQHGSSAQPPAQELPAAQPAGLQVLSSQKELRGHRGAPSHHAPPSGPGLGSYSGIFSICTQPLRLSSDSSLGGCRCPPTLGSLNALGQPRTTLPQAQSRSGPLSPPSSE